MTLHIRSTPQAAYALETTAFKIFFPRELTQAQARAVWDALRADEYVVLADPFALENVSTVFPGVIYSEDFNNLERPAALLDALGDEEYLADGWIELWVPDVLEDQAEALDVIDLTQPPED